MSKMTDHIIRELEHSGRAPGGSTGHFPRQKCINCGALKRKPGPCSKCECTVFLVLESN